MYYKINKNIMFRMYEKYGFITDNSLFGYKSQKYASWFPGEKYISKSAAVILNTLGKKPKHIDEIIEELVYIFIGVSKDELKIDVEVFFNQLVDEGFLSYGISLEECNQYKLNNLKESKSSKSSNSAIGIENCSKDTFKQKDFLRSIHIEIANECNERCVHCYIPHEYKLNCIGTDLFYKIIEEGRELNIINVTLSGGEPLLHKDIIDFLKKCRELDLSVNLLTNLTLLTGEIIEEMKKNPLLSVQTSLYSMNPEVHDSITKVKGSFEKTKDSLMKLYEKEIPLQISCPVMKQNKDTFNDVVKWGSDKDISVAVEFVIFGAYDNSNCNLINRLSLQEVELAFDKQISKESVNMHYEIAKEKSQLTKDNAICSICRYNFCVSAEGEVFPCVGWNKNVLGNLNIQSISEIWDTSVEIKRLKSIKRDSFPKCIKCEDRGYCTICMMSNSNENEDGDEFRINSFHCDVASMIHNKIRSYLKEHSDME